MAQNDTPFKKPLEKSTPSLLRSGSRFRSTPETQHLASSPVEARQNSVTVNVAEKQKNLKSSTALETQKSPPSDGVTDRGQAENNEQSVQKSLAKSKK